MDVNVKTQLHKCTLANLHSNLMVAQGNNQLKYIFNFIAGSLPIITVVVVFMENFIIFFADKIRQVPWKIYPCTKIDMYVHKFVCSFTKHLC